MGSPHSCRRTADAIRHVRPPRRGPFRRARYARWHRRIPLLDGCAACLQCERVALYDGGDHAILLGKVLTFSQRAAAAPLATEVIAPCHAPAGGADLAAAV